MRFLKYTYTDYQLKPYGSDGMNGYGKNLNRSLPDMMEYWNFLLTNDLQTSTRQKYTWLDNFAFIGGNIDFILLGLGAFFSIYNYNVARTKLYYQHHMTRAIKSGRCDSKETINIRIKHREEWRPFAGIMLEEYQEEYFTNVYHNEYMLYSLVVRPHQRKKLGAITHKDFSCRIQTVNNQLHPEINTLLQKYNEETNCPVLLNTSFNDNGQPIVESPKDAVQTFNNIDLDYLVIGNYIVSKK